MEIKPWTHTSASQIKTFKRCNRRWWYDKICAETELVFNEKQLATFRYGTVTHEIIEDFLEGKEDRLAEDPYVNHARPYLESLKEITLSTEDSLNLPTRHEDVEIVGFIDVETTKGVVDHKTTSDPKWALDERELLTDPQVNLYLYWRLLRFAIEPGMVEGTLNYLQKPGRGKRPKNWQVTIEKTPGEIRENFDSLLDTIDQQRIYSTKTDPKDVPENTDACGDYGGCPFLKDCPKKRPNYNRGLQGPKTRKDIMAKTAFGKSPKISAPKKEEPKKIKKGQTHAEKVVLATLRAKVPNPNFIIQLGIVDKDLTEVLNLLDGAKLLFNMGHPVDVSTIDLPEYTEFVRVQDEKAGKVAPEDARENHPKGAKIDNKTGDTISDLQAADITPKTREGLESLGCTTLSDISGFTEAQILDLPYVGGKAFDKLSAIMEEAGLTFLPEGLKEEPKKEEEPKSDPKGLAERESDPLPPKKDPPAAALAGYERLKITIGHTYQPAPYESVKVEVTYGVLDNEDLGEAMEAANTLLEELTKKEMAKHK